MKLFGREFSWNKKAADAISLDTLIRRLDAIWETSSGVSVTPENCEQSPTCKAVVTAVTRRFAVMPVHVLQKTMSNGRTTKELLPNHPVERLLNRPNWRLTNTEYWMDSASRLLRYGNCFNIKTRGITGPIRNLIPVRPAEVVIHEDDNLNLTYRITLASGGQREYQPWEVHHIRTSSRDGICGDSPVMDVREAISLEIAAEKFGASFFGNGAMPGIVFEYAEGSQGFPTDAERWAFLEAFDEKYNKKGRFKAIFPPKGVKMGTPIPVENDKAQFLQLRQYQRTVIAGAFGVPPHLVGDLSKGTFNNVEQQGIAFTQNVILPLTMAFEAAMERDLLTDEDRRGGVIIRFNTAAHIRGSFLEQQQALKIMREAGVYSANDWREEIGRNPLSDEDGGNEYWRQGPSGQSANPVNGNDGTASDPEDEEDADSTSE